MAQNQQQIIYKSFDLSLLQKSTTKQIKKFALNRPEIRIVYFGTANISAIVLAKLIEFCQNPIPQTFIGHPTHLPTLFTLQAVITQPDKPIGRQQIITPSPVALMAEKFNIPLLKPEKLDENFIKNHLSLLDSDLFILASFGKLIPQPLLEIPQYGALNVHPSLLPKYRGPSPIQNTILNGDKKTGVTIIKMDTKMDHGPIIYTNEIRLSGQDTLETLSKKLFELGAELLVQIIPDFISGKIKPIRQNDEQVTFTHIIKKEDGYFDINNPPSPQKLDKMIRAYYPWPNVWTKWPFDSAQGKNLKIVKFYPGGLIQMEGKKPVPLADFLRGHPNFPIKNL